MIPEYEVIIPACGRGKRFQSDIPKQFISINDIPVLIHTLKVFDDLKGLYGIIVVCDGEYREYVESIVKKYGIKKVRKIVVGGKRRQDSVYNGIKALELKKLVVVHDAVRPCVEKDVVLRGVKYADEFGASCAGFPAVQTLGIAENGFLVKNLDRNACWVLATPQCFKYSILYSSYENAKKENFFATDDTQIVIKYTNQKIKLYESNVENVKMTYKTDLEIVGMYLRNLRR